MDGSEAFELVAGMVWGVVAVVCGFYFIGCYLLEILAQKLDEPRWMAWVPIANGYLVFRLAGWGGWFGALIAGWVLAGIASAISPGFALIIMIPVGLAMVIISFIIWLKIAERRGLSQMVGLLIVAPNFVPLLEVALPTGGLLTLASWLASLLAFAYLVFYDGSAEHSPHFVGYVVTTCLAAAIGFPMVMLANDPELMESFQSDFEAAQAGEEMEGETLWEDFGLESEDTEIAAPPTRATLPTYEPPADTCGEGARSAGKRPPEGNHWWCETMIAGQWQRHGPVRKWFDHGGVESEGNYRAGAEQGTWTRYWKTGGAKVRADFRDGQQHGWMRSWDEIGRLESEVYYEYGQPTTLPASN